ncbi:hypothetical protein ASG32_24210 [Methylobacterium sp. Leaf361]|uniref:hypothetical protein n=1 Tax=Methylobacterium sp. Leaf361 TaxID=1736352 RepID=UPI0006F1E48C|nr:hypothetical protein [Methylobacterium sp. Leaf361]KQS79943.1 hypothetical protein ASG32_24210 [Methylobacterium sp. Leaf361]
MTPAEQRAEMLAALADAEAFRDGVDRMIGTLRRVLAVTATTTPVLTVPNRPEWLPIKAAARELGIEPMAARRRAQRGLRTGRGRKVGGRLQLHLPSQPETGDG